LSKLIYFFIFLQGILFSLVFAKDINLSDIAANNLSACTVNPSSSLNSQTGINNIDQALEQIIPKLKNPECTIVQNHGLDGLVGGKLSAFWGYDFIGVDLALEELAPLKAQMTSVKTATSEIVNLKEVPNERLSLSLKEMAKTQESQAYYGHGTSVANIIYGNSPLGISTKSELTISNLFSKNNEDKSAAFNDLLASKIKVFQSSESVRYPEDLTKMREQGIISFRSAGNEYPSNDISQAVPETSVIVGQLSPLGGMSSDSSAYGSVKIAAPGRVYSYRNGETHLFGGTSGAQPVATGCFLNVVSLLPDVTPDEADALIQKAAIPTLNFREKTGSNGQGTVNCLKLAKVASRLKGEWPQNRKKIIDPLLYDFQNESKNFEDAAEKLKGSKKPCDIAERLKLLRKAFLLDSSNKQTIAKLAQLYRNLGFSGNAALYESMLGFSPEQIKELYNEFKGTEFEADAIRLIADFYPEQKGVLATALTSPDEETVLLTAHVGKNKLMEKQVQQNLLRILKDGKIDSMNSPVFFKEYFENYKFPATDIMKACEEKMPQWEKEELSDSITNCSIALSYDEKTAPQFILKQLKRNSATFKKNFLDYATGMINSSKSLPNLLVAIAKAPEWSEAERLQISDLLKQSDLRPRAEPGNSKLSPNIFITDETNTKLVLSNSGNKAAQMLENLKNTYGIHLSQKFLGGVIVSAKNGFDVCAALDDPLILPWYKESWPLLSKEERLWVETDAKELMKCAKEYEPRTDKLIGYTYAIIPFRHIFIQGRDLSGEILDEKNGKIISTGEELLFHESMHILHDSVIPKEVESFLKIPGGFYSRLAKIQSVCPPFKERVGERPGFIETDKTFCGYKSKNELYIAYAQKYKIPQRHGKNTGKFPITPIDQCWEMPGTPIKKITIENKDYCRDSDLSHDEDIHAVNDSAEYFAIMMESYIFNRAEFDRVALPAERAFVEKIIEKYLH